MESFAGIALLFLTQIGCDNPSAPNRVENQAMQDKYEAFIKKPKFEIGASIGYAGLADPTLLPILTRNINLAARDFQAVATRGATEDKEYLNAVRSGLDRFRGMQLDTEEREQVCCYFEELMDLAGVESSGGLLNEFMYGFDPE